jgi:hypothetical protein
MFAGQAMVAEYIKRGAAILATYNSGTDGHYISKDNQKKLGLSILRISAKKVGTADGNTCNGKYVTALPFPQLSKMATAADTFNDFPTLLMSVGKMADNGNLSNQGWCFGSQRTGHPDHMQGRSDSHQ